MKTRIEFEAAVDAAGIDNDGITFLDIIGKKIDHAHIFVRVFGSASAKIWLNMLGFLKDAFNKRRSTAIVAAVSLVTIYEFSKIRVPRIIENKLAFRLGFFAKAIIRQLVIHVNSFRDLTSIWSPFI